MTAQKLLDELQRRGGRAWTEAGRLELEAPPGVLSERVLQSLAAWKPQLVELLQSPAAPPLVVVPVALSPRALFTAARRIDKRLVLTTAERFELGVKLACIDCGRSTASF